MTVTSPWALEAQSGVHLPRRRCCLPLALGRVRVLPALRRRRVRQARVRGPTALAADAAAGAAAHGASRGEEADAATASSQTRARNAAVLQPASARLALEALLRLRLLLQRLLLLLAAE